RREPAMEAASLEEVRRSIELLEALVADPTLTAGLSEEERIRLMTAAGRLSRPARLERIAVARTVRKERRKRALHDFQPPLDIVDGAARILDPLISGLLAGTHLYGKFFKDYCPSTW
ncbi:MAG: hypothetical protein L0170_14855, partial [Acidobacteria bacterium]|nr:hypothetical protein [Acidobacteriota bacterium]